MVESFLEFIIIIIFNGKLMCLNINQHKISNNLIFFTKKVFVLFSGLSTRQIQVWFQNHRRKLKSERNLVKMSQEIERRLNKL